LYSTINLIFTRKSETNSMEHSLPGYRKQQTTPYLIQN